MSKVQIPLKIGGPLHIQDPKRGIRLRDGKGKNPISGRDSVSKGIRLISKAPADVIDCPEGLVSKPIIDRLGRHSHRCVRQAGTGDTVGAINVPQPVEDRSAATDTKIYNAWRKTTMKQVLEAIGIDESEQKGAGWQFAMRDAKAKADFALSPYTATTKAWADWEVSSVSRKSSNLQRAFSMVMEDDVNNYAKATKGLEEGGTSSYQLDPEFDDNEQYRTHLVEDVQASMDLEQEYWKSKGVTHIKLYRGLKVGIDKEVGMREDMQVGSRHVITDFPGSSWSLFPHVADGFGEMVLGVEVPVEDILGSTFSTIQSPAEGEFVIYNHPEGREVEVVHWSKYEPVEEDD